MIHSLKYSYNSKRFVVELLIGISILLALFIFFSIQPLKGVNNWSLSIAVLAIIMLVFLLSRWIKAEDFFFNKFIGIWSIPFVFIGIFAIVNANWHGELIYTYQTLFNALSYDLNPYVQKVIYHRMANGSAILSTFNYLPGEIFPYYIGYLLFKQWNFGIMLIINFIINLVATFLVVFHIPKINRSTKIFYSLLLLLTSITHSASFVFFLIMLAALLLLYQKEDPSLKLRLAIVVIMGLGTVAKFFMLPFIFLYFWNTIIEKKDYSYIVDASGVAIIFLLFTMPFGVYNVIYSTILFNLNLSQRAQVTTYYLNIVSGFCYYTHLQILYGIIAMVLFFLSVVLTKNIPFHKRLLYVSLIALIIFPTPEDQFLGSIFGLLVISKLDELRNSNYPLGSDSLFQKLRSKLNLMYTHIKDIKISKNKHIFQ